MEEDARARLEKIRHREENEMHVLKARRTSKSVALLAGEDEKHLAFS